MPTQSAKQSEAAGHHNACVAICSDAQGLSTIPLSDLFIPSKAAIRVSYLVKDEYKAFNPKSGKHGSQAVQPPLNPIQRGMSQAPEGFAQVCVTLHRKNGDKSSFRLRLSNGDTDIEREDMKIEVDLHELGTRDDAFVLMCAEDDNRFERYMSRQEHCKNTPVLMRMTIFCHLTESPNGKLH